MGSRRHARVVAIAAYMNTRLKAAYAALHHWRTIPWIVINYNPPFIRCAVYLSNPAREIPRIPLGWNNCQLRYETITSPRGCLTGLLGSDGAVALYRDRELDFPLAYPRSLAQENDTALSVLWKTADFKHKDVYQQIERKS